jgi:hypothetical protein
VGGWSHCVLGYGVICCAVAREALHTTLITGYPTLCLHSECRCIPQPCTIQCRALEVLCLHPPQLRLSTEPLFTNHHHHPPMPPPQLTCHECSLPQQP